MTADAWMGIALGFPFGALFMAIVMGAVIDRHHGGDE